MSGEFWDHFFQNSSAGRVLGAFGQGMNEAAPPRDLGLSEESAAELRRVGIFNDVAAGQNSVFRAFNEALMRPAAYALDAIISTPIRLGTAAIAGLQAATVQAGKETGQETLARTLAAIPEDMGEAALVHSWGGVSAPREGAAPRAPITAPELAEAQRLGVIGGTEGTWRGTTPPANDVKLTPPPEQPEPAAPAPPDVHAIARTVAPDVFERYDPLAQQRDQLRQQIATEQARLRTEAEAQNPRAAEIADLERRLAGMTPRMEERYGADLRARLADAREAFADQFALLTRDTPEIQAMRQELQRVDQGMRDMAPQVSAAYREAEARMPAAEPVQETPGASILSPPEAAEAPASTPPGSAAPERPVQAAEESRLAGLHDNLVAAITGDLDEKLDRMPDGATHIRLTVTDAEREQLRAAGIDINDDGMVPYRDAALLLQERSRRVRLGGGTNSVPGSKGAAALTTLRGLLSRSEAEDAKWPDHPPSNKTNVLRAQIARLEARLAEGTEGPPESAPPAPAAESKPGELPLAGDAGKPTVEPAKIIPAAFDVAGDVAKKLMAAGRPAEEAQAAGQLLAAHYEARAARFEGKRGTGADLYRADAPEVRAAAVRKAGAKAAREMAQKGGKELSQSAKGKILFRDGMRPLITLMRDADASTFLHETGHAWLEELLHDAAHALAPESLRADAATVRSWLGAEEGKPISTRQHERFARSFEQYMMEGHAPSQALAGVFAKFRDWLTAIYQTITRLGRPINADIRDVFDRLLAHEPAPRAVVAPDREFITRATEPSPEMAIGTVPPEPRRLIDFLRSPTVLHRGTVNEKRIPGGVRDTGGDVLHILGGDHRARPGLINNKSGRGLDEAARLAGEAGYFPEHGNARPDINDLLEKIAEDHRGNPQYSMHDYEAARAHHEAMARNAEVDRLAAEHGIDPKGLTRAEFYDRVTAKVGEAEAQARADAHAENAAVAHEDMDESREEDGIYGSPEPGEYGTPRTSEDIDRELRSEYDSENLGQRAAGAGEPAGEPENQAVRQGDEGPRGSGAGPGRRDQENADGQGAEQRRSTAQRVIDPAGNIRLELLDNEADGKALMREVAEENGDFLDQRRGVRTDAYRDQVANTINMTGPEANARYLEDNIVKDGIGLDARARALRMFTSQQSDVVAALLAKADETKAPEDIVAALAARQKMAWMQGILSGVTAQAGRTLRAYHDLKKAIANKEANLDSEIVRITGRTLYQIERENQKLLGLVGGSGRGGGKAGVPKGAIGDVRQGGLDIGTQGRLSKAVRDMERPGLFDWFQTMYINALLSGPFTHIFYTAAGELYAGFRALGETGVAAAVGGVRRAAGIGPADYVHGREVVAASVGGLRGMREGVRAAWDAFLTNEPLGNLPAEVRAMKDVPAHKSVGIGDVIPNPDVAGVRLPIGTVLESPSRLATALHSFNWTTFYRSSLSHQAMHVALEEGRTGADLIARATDLEANPTDTILKQAARDATDGALLTRPQYGSLMNAISRVTNWGVPMGNVPLPGGGSFPLGTFRPIKFIDPFVQIAATIQRHAIVRGTPFELFSPEVRDDLAMRNGGAAFDRTAGRILAGTTLAAVGGWLALRGLINPSGPTDPNERAAWAAAHGDPHTVTIGGTSVDLLRLGPLGVRLSIMADLAMWGHLLSEGDMAKAAAYVVHAFSQNILDESFMRGPAELLKALEDSDRYGAKYLRNLAASAMPFSVGLSQTTHLIDPYTRQARSFVDALLAKVPLASESLPVRVDVWGAPIPSKATSMIYADRATNDPTIRYLAALRERGLLVWPAMPSREISGVKLTDEQYNEFAGVAGRNAKARLDALVNAPGFHLVSDAQQQQSIREAIESAREMASVLMSMRHPELIQQATELKLQLLNAGRRAK